MTPLRAPILGIGRHRLLGDGDGVTTLVAFSGCPLRCKYCLNPQCLSAETEIVNYSCQELYDVVKIDNLYFLATNGGITWGGGEPCLQSAFISQFRNLCGQNWRITVETSLNVNPKHLETLLPVVDNYIIDIKETNPQIYSNYTGKDNAQVISNLKWLVDRGKAAQMLIRVPLIEKFNTQRDIERSIDQLQKIGLQNFDLFTYQTNTDTK